VIGPIHPASKTGHLGKGGISLAVNGTVKQNSNLLNMSWNVAEQVSKLSEAFELKAGDIIYSGTRRMSAPCSRRTCCCARSRVCRTCRSRSSEGVSAWRPRESGAATEHIGHRLRDTSISKRAAPCGRERMINRQGRLMQANHGYRL